MEPSRRAVVLAAVIVYLNTRRGKARRQAFRESTVRGSWRLAALADILESDVAAW